MSSARRDRLEAYLATLRAPAQDTQKRRLANWPLYAAVTGSAMAMATNASVPYIANNIGLGANANPLVAELPFVRSHEEPLIRAVKLAMAMRSATHFEGVAPAMVQASQSNTPTIEAGGVVPLYGTVSTIQPGGWASIYGTNLASGTAIWNEDFPTSLGGTSVTINGKPAYLSFVSSGQINFQAPDDTALGPVSVVVTTSAGQATSSVTLHPYSPAFELRDARHVTAIIIRSDGSGAYGDGGYDILGPTGDCFGYPTVAAQTGDVVELFGVGFGPTNPPVPAGQVFSGAAPITEIFSININGVFINPTFVGLSSAGVYQINLVVPPGIGQGDVPILARVGTRGTQPNALFSLPGGTLSEGSCVYTGDGGDGGDGGAGAATVAMVVTVAMVAMAVTEEMVGMAATAVMVETEVSAATIEAASS